MSRFKNSRKSAFLDTLPTISIETDSDRLTQKCKFNFGYMDFSQKAGQKFSVWEQERQLAKLLDKIVEYTREPLSWWIKQRIGKRNNKVLEVYQKFPPKSDFIYPKHIPHDVHWARFRLEWEARLIGFVIPKEFEGRRHHNTGLHFDCNTFYVVFLDANHKFWKTK